MDLRGAQQAATGSSMASHDVHASLRTLRAEGDEVAALNARLAAALGAIRRSKARGTPGGAAAAPPRRKGGKGKRQRGAEHAGGDARSAASASNGTGAAHAVVCTWKEAFPRALRCALRAPCRAWRRLPRPGSLRNGVAMHPPMRLPPSAPLPAHGPAFQKLLSSLLLALLLHARQGSTL